MKVTNLFLTNIFYLCTLLTVLIITYSCKDNNNKNQTVNEERPFFRDDFDTIDENIWEVGTWTEHGGQLGRERLFVHDGILHMQLINMDGVFLTSAIQTKESFLYGKWEVRLKPTSVPGVLNSFYTIDWGDGNATRQEVDIEFLTSSFDDNSGEVHFAVHAAGLKSYNSNPDFKLDFNPSDDFHIWGLDITPDHIEWSVDGNSLFIYKYSDYDIKIDAPYVLKLNTWTQEEWIKGPPASGQISTYYIDWVQFSPYDEFE